MNRRARRGSSAVEFWFILPIFVALIGAGADYSWYLQQRSLLASAVREGVRVSATTPLAASPDPAAVAVTRTLAVLADLGVDGSSAAVSSTYSDLRAGLSCNTVDAITVTATIPFTAIARLIPTPSDMTVSMSMMLEDGDCA